MSYNLHKTISEGLDQNDLSLIELSASIENVSLGVNAFLPVIINGFCHNATTSTSANVLYKAILNRREQSNHKITDSELSKNLFSEKTTVYKQIANHSNLSVDQTVSLSEILTSKVLDMLDSRIKSQTLSASDLRDMLYQQKPLVDAELSTEFKDHMLYADASLRENDSAFIRKTEVIETSNDWWKWMIGAIFSIALLGWLFQDGCTSANEGFKDGIGDDMHFDEEDLNRIREEEAQADSIEIQEMKQDSSY